MKNSYYKILILAIILALVANLVLFALRMINAALFWIIIAFGAVFAYFILPKLRI